MYQKRGICIENDELYSDEQEVLRNLPPPMAQELLQHMYNKIFRQVPMFKNLVRFQWKNPAFLLKNPDFLLRNADFLLKNVDF